MNINKAMLGGNIGTDPTLRTTGSGRVVCNFRMATNEVWTNAQGNREERTTWHSITAWGQVGENIVKFFKKGDPIFIEGRIRTNKWQTEDGQDRQRQEVVCDRFHFIGGRKAASAPADDVTQDDGTPDVPFEDVPEASGDEIPV
jgi:single-strand DNA-binding protein